MHKISIKCPKCQKIKSVTEFHKHKNKPSGYQTHCVSCRSISIKRNTKFVYKNKHLSKNKLRKCPQCEEIKKFEDFFNHKQSKNGKDTYCKKCTKIKSSSKTINKFFNNNLTQNESINLLIEHYIKQNKCCAICKKQYLRANLHIDHCHETNKFRGLLCKNCNFALGFFKDNIDLLLNAIVYLQWPAEIVKLISNKNPTRFISINKTLRKYNLKICNDCEQQKSLNAFHGVTNGKYASKCNNCYNLYYKKIRYGLNKENINFFIKKQNNKCAICKEQFKNSNIHIDHCHKNKTVRGLLCPACNVGLGQIHDNIDLLLNCINYLETKGGKKYSICKNCGCSRKEHWEPGNDGCYEIYYDGPCSCNMECERFNF